MSTRSFLISPCSFPGPLPAGCFPFRAFFNRLRSALDILLFVTCWVFCWVSSRFCVSCRSSSRSACGSKITSECPIFNSCRRAGRSFSSSSSKSSKHSSNDTSGRFSVCFFVFEGSSCPSSSSFSSSWSTWKASLARCKSAKKLPRSANAPISSISSATSTSSSAPGAFRMKGDTSVISCDLRSKTHLAVATVTPALKIGTFPSRAQSESSISDTFCDTHVTETSPLSNFFKRTSPSSC
mmetsp:Transcript_20959/g.34156  ORF Transcript_20959/g.34156 Transcript_20959/m.34156 type:complete len:239 (+) Transcript_20959:213-929(+)